MKLIIMHLLHYRETGASIGIKLIVKKKRIFAIVIPIHNSISKTISYIDSIFNKDKTNERSRFFI